MRDATILREIGKALLDGELDHGWQRTVARAIGVSDATVSDILRGNRKMTEAVRAAAEQKLEEVRS